MQASLEIVRSLGCRLGGRKLVALVGLVMLGLVAVAGCGGPAAPGPEPSPSAASTAASSSPSASNAVGFADTFRFDDGATVAVDQVEHAKLGKFPETDDPNAKEGDPYVVISFTATNGTTGRLEIVCDASLTLSDGTLAHTVSTYPWGCELHELDPGESASIALAYLVPAEARGRVQLSVRISVDPLRVAEFSGELPL